MNNDALTSDAATLVAELRSDAALDPVAMDRLRERLAISLTLAQLPSASPPAGPTAAAAVRGGNGLLASRFGGLALFVLGTAVGAWGHALVGAKPERTAQSHVAVTRRSADTGHRLAQQRNVRGDDGITEALLVAEPAEHHARNQRTEQTGQEARPAHK